MDNDVRETAAVSSNDRRDTPVKVCEHCGSAIDTSDWFPVTHERDSDGSLQFYHFCDEACERSWLEANEA